jgi:hypothetical protein
MLEHIMKIDRTQWTLSLFMGLGLALLFAVPLIPAGCAGTVGDEYGDDDAAGDDDATSAGDDDAAGDDDSSSAGDDDVSTDPCMKTDGYTNVKDICTGQPLPDLVVNCCEGTIPTYEQVRAAVYEKTCLNCHSTSKVGAERNGAPTTVNFDTAELASADPQRYSHIVYYGYMPFPYCSKPLTEEEKQLHYRWELCATH